MGLSVVKFLVIINIFSIAWVEFNKIANTNLLKIKAENAYLKKEYSLSVLYYDSLITFYKSDDEIIRLNLAHSLFKNEQKKRAVAEYQLLSKSTDIQISSIAFQQLGFIEVMKGKNNEAINNFKLALKINPSNEIARYNYELLKKLMEQELSTSNKSAANKESSKKGQKEGYANIINKDGVSSSEKGKLEDNGELHEINESGQKQNKSTSEASSTDNQELKSENKGDQEKEKLKIRLFEMNMSLEKANRILQEMNNEEIQYIQQLKRKPSTKENKMKQDW